MIRQKKNRRLQKLAGAISIYMVYRHGAWFACACMCFRYLDNFIAAF